MRLRVVLVIALLALMASAHALEPGGSDACRGPAADFGSDGRIGAKWNAATRTIAYGRTAVSGAFHTFLADADGGHERRLTTTQWRDDRHQFPAAWHPNGQWLAMLIEKSAHDRGSVDATPGYGAYSDYWLVTRDASRAWKLYELPDGYDHAITRSRTPRSRQTAPSSSGPNASKRRASST